MNKQRHIIKKQIIELNLSSQQGAFELQNEVSRIYRHKVIPLIDNLLSQFSDSETIHRINTLEIHLGNIEINHLEQELIDKILEKIQQQLAEKISLSNSSLSTQPQPNTESNNSSLPLTRTEAFFNKIDGNTGDNTRVNKITSVNVTRYEIPSNRIGKSDIASTRATQLEIFSYFIQTGMLPWWAEKLSKQELEECCDRLLETSPEQFKLILAESFQQEKYSRRIIYQFSDSILFKFTQLLSSNSSDFITNYHNDIQQIYQRKIDIFANISPSEFRLELWRGIFFGLLFEQYNQSKNIQFIRNHLLHISASFRLNYLLMSDKMREAVENLEQEGGNFKSQLPAILAQINPLVVKKNSNIARERGSQLEIFSYFIQTGNLPERAEKLSKQELEEYCDRLLKTSSEQLKLILAESFQQEKYSRRIIYQFSDSTLLKFTQLLASNSSEVLTDYHKDIQQIYQRKINILANISPSEFRLELWRGIFFGLLFEQYTQSKNIQFIRNHLLHIAASFRLNYLLMIDKMREAVENLEQEGGNFNSQLPEILAQINPLVVKKNSKITSESEQSINLEEVTFRHTSDPDSLSQPEDRLINTVTPFSDSEEIYIYNSGLVLLWPFLPRFFETLKLMQQGHFVNSESAERAVLILQYLVDAATEIPEQFLSLNKILCGIDLLEPVTANLEIAEPQRDECEHLLSAVIGNSSILKNTSIDGFKRAFLQREGILKVRDCSWLLQVEQETYDVLLDRLPWSIRVVKLPWMDEILYVEW